MEVFSVAVEEVQNERIELIRIGGNQESRQQLLECIGPILVFQSRIFKQSNHRSKLDFVPRGIAFASSATRSGTVLLGTIPSFVIRSLALSRSGRDSAVNREILNSTQDR